MTIDCSAALPTQLQYLTRARACPQQPTVLALSAIQGTKGDNCLTFSHYTLHTYTCCSRSVCGLVLPCVWPSTRRQHRAAMQSPLTQERCPSQLSGRHSSWPTASIVAVGCRGVGRSQARVRSMQHRAISHAASFRHFVSRPETWHRPACRRDRKDLRASPKIQRHQR